MKRVWLDDVTYLDVYSRLYAAVCLIENTLITGAVAEWIKVVAFEALRRIAIGMVRVRFPAGA